VKIKGHDKDFIDLCTLSYCLPDELIPNSHAKSNSDIPLFDYLGFVNSRHSRACLSEIVKEFRAAYPESIRDLNGNKRGMLALSYMDKKFRRKRLKSLLKEHISELDKKANPLKAKKHPSSKSSAFHFPTPEFNIIKLAKPIKGGLSESEFFEKEAERTQSTISELEQLGVEKGLLEDPMMKYFVRIWEYVIEKGNEYEALDSMKKMECLLLSQCCWDLFEGDTYKLLSQKIPVIESEFSIARKVASLKLDRSREFSVWLDVFNNGPQALDNYFEPEKKPSGLILQENGESITWEGYFTKLHALATEAMSAKPALGILKELDHLISLRTELPEPEPEKTFPFREPCHPLQDLAFNLRAIMSNSSSDIVSNTLFHDKIIAYWQDRILDTLNTSNSAEDVLSELNDKVKANQELEVTISDKTLELKKLRDDLKRLEEIDCSNDSIAKLMDHEDNIGDLEDNIANCKSKLARLERKGHQSFLGSTITIEELDHVNAPDLLSVSIDHANEPWLESLSAIKEIFAFRSEHKQTDAQIEESADELPEIKIPEELLVEEYDITEPELKQDSEQITEIENIDTEIEPAGTLTEENIIEPDNTIFEELDDVEQVVENEPVDEVIEDKEKILGQETIVASVDVEPALIELNLNGSDITDLLKHSWDARGYFDAARINQLALLLVNRAELTSAYQVLKHAEQSESIEGTLLPSELFKAAIIGLHTWKAKSTSIPYLQELFSSTLNVSRIEKWETEAKPFGRLISTLAFSASFQPALWIGNDSNAPQLLNQIKSQLEAPVADFTEECHKQINQGFKFSLEALSDQTAVKERLSTIASQLKQWHQRIEKLDKGYAPAIKGIKKALKDGELSVIVDIILNMKVSEMSKVKEFCQTYATQVQQTELVRDFVEFVQPGSGDGLQGHALSQMTRMCEELVIHASDWLDEINKKDNIFQVSDFARQRFLTQLDGVIERLTKGDEKDLPKAAARSLLRITFANLKAAIESPQSVEDGDLQLPVDMTWPIDRDSRISDKSSPEEVILILGDSLDEDWTPLEACRKAIDLELYHSARVLLNRASIVYDVTDLEENWKSARAREKKLLLMLINTTTSQLYNAHLCSILDDTKYYQIKSEIESIEDLIQKPDDYRDFRRLRAGVEFASGQINEVMALKLQRFQADLDVLFDQDEANDPKLITKEWREHVDKAFEGKNIAVIEEMLDQAKEALKTNQKIPVLSNDEGKLLSDFRKREKTFSTFFLDNAAKQAKTWLTNDAGNGNKLSGSKEFSKCVYNMLLDAEQRKKPLKKLDQTFYFKVKHLFDFLGIQFREQSFKSQYDIDFDYKTSNQFSFVRIPVKSIEAGRPFPDFGEHQRTSLPIIIAWDQWATEDLADSLGYFGEDLANAFFISHVPVKPEQRDRYTTWCKGSHITMQLVDPVLIAYIGMSSLITQSKHIQNTLNLTMPFTFSNPYRDDMKPAPLEMRYGREREFQALMRLSGGAAFITGGRQMGKSTILHEVQKRFHKQDQNQYSFLLHFDQYNPKALDHSRIKTILWEWMYDQCCECGLLERKNLVSNGDRHKEYADALVRLFSEDKNIRVMFLLDEMDQCLEADAKAGFELFRGLRALVDQSQQRCKIAVAGLQSVKRFESMPNHPLYQLGSSLVVGIMKTQDALQLIKEPMAALGYQFADELAPMRILALTNRHPGLIQVFCKHLVDSLAKQSSAVGSFRITSEYIEQLYGKTEELKKEVINRFEITLNLDTSYLIIIYSLLLNELGAAPFLASEAKKHAEDWKTEFSGMSETQFSAYLDELVGLGVLRQEANNSREYQLRNANIRNLLGTEPERIEDKLIAALEDAENTDPLETHRMVADKKDFLRPSPLNYRDEKMIVGLDSRREENALIENKKEPPIKPFQISIIQGSRALGIDDITESLSPIREIENFDGVDEHYHIKQLKKADGVTIRQFLNGVQSSTHIYPVAAIVPVSIFQDIFEMADLLEEILGLKPSFESAAQPVRFVFVMNPSSFWNWIRNENIAESQSETPEINIIRLQKWTKCALSQLLTHLEMDDSSTSAELLLEYSFGWYSSLRKLSEVVANGKESNISRLPNYGKLDQLDAKTSRIFLNDAVALNQMAWVEPLLGNLIQIESEPMAKSDLIEWFTMWIEENTELSELGGCEDILLNWLIVLQIVVLETRKTGNAQKYILDPVIAAAWRKVSE
jgi:hypothetical protein